MSQQDLADAIGLSAPSTGDRLRKLVDKGVITEFRAIIDPDAVGKDVAAFIALRVDGREHFPSILERANATPEILECHAITGEGSHLCKVRTSGTSGLENLLATIQSWPGVSSTRTMVVLSVAKEGTLIHVDPEEPGSDD